MQTTPIKFGREPIMSDPQEAATPSDPHSAEAGFRFTDAQWREFQNMPEQGYSHRHWLEHTFNSWRDGEDSF